MGKRSELWKDIGEQFDFVEDKLVYVDAPLQGFLRSRDGDLFAFRCVPILPNSLWHWILLPSKSAGDSVDDVFGRAQTAVPDYWISVVEDRRADSRLFAVWMDGSKDKIPV